MKRRAYIGIDCGTTNVKAVLYDQNGDEVGIFSRKNDVIVNGPESEQDMEALYANVAACLRELSERHSDEFEFRALGIAGQGEGLWALDSDGHPVCNAMLWNDARAAGLVAKLKESGSYEDWRRRLGTYFKNGSTIVLIKWLHDNRPEDYSRTRWFLSCKDYIRYRLTGELRWELSDASASCVDLYRKEYARDIFEALGIGSAVDRFPPLVGAAESAGAITSEASAATGLPEGLKVSGGMLDVLANPCGLGAVKPGDTCVILGTTGMISCIIKDFAPDDRLCGWGYTIDGSSFGRGMGFMSATPNFDWMIDKLFPGVPVKDVYAEVEKELKGRRPGSSGLIYHPHISVSGERAPFQDADATASLIGIRQDTTRFDMVQAVMEGVAMAVYDCLLLKDDTARVFLSGGGAKSDAWAQMVADAVGREVYVTRASETAAKGAAFSAAIMIGDFQQSTGTGDGFFSVKRKFTPDPRNHKLFGKLYGIYKSTQSAMVPFWKARKAYLEEM